MKLTLYYQKDKMGDSWETTPANMATREPALTEASNGTHAGPPRDEAKAQLAREKGWVEQQNFDYSATIPPQEQVTDNPLSTGTEVQGWMSRARKYEWQEEYGDLGPEIPELEAELFGSELRLKKGVDFNKYAFQPSHIHS